MSLASALSELKNELSKSFKNIGNPPNPGNTPMQFAKDFANACYNFATKGMPMTIHNGIPPIGGLMAGQTVTGGVTSTPGNVKADGIGGIDKPTPGIGLKAAKPILEQRLKLVFSNTMNTVDSASQQIAQAIFDFLSQAKVMTKVVATIPPGIPVPPPAGPVGVGTYNGSGIGGIESTSGTGLASMLPVLISNLSLIFSNNMNTPEIAAKKVANELESFYMKAIVQTQDTGSAGGGPAAVALPPAPPSGSTLPPGSQVIFGKSTSGKII